MSLKLKVLGLGLLAMLATSAFSVMNAGANGEGHADVEGATSETPVTIRGAEGEGHRIHLTRHDRTGPIGCDIATYAGQATSSTPTSLVVTPTYEECYTTNTSPKVVVTPTMEGCQYRFEVQSNGTNGTVDLICPPEKTVRVHHPNCNITVRESENQNMSGVHYTTITEGGKHALTIHVDVTIKTQYHTPGICVFLGTSQSGWMTGTVKVWAEHNGERRHLTVTPKP